MADDTTTSRVMYLIHRARVATADAVGDALADLELNGTLSLILETLYELGEASAADLARRCLVRRQALTAPLNELERRGLIRRPESATNVRVRLIALTEQGRALTEQVRERVQRLEGASLSAFEPAELPVLLELLDRYAGSWERLAGGRR